jgi:hypothetical protein
VIRTLARKRLKSPRKIRASALRAIDIRIWTCSHDLFGANMKTRSPLGCLIVVLGGLAASGCIASPDEEVSLSDGPSLHSDALTQNALTQNALTQNALTQNALTQNALTQNALTQNALTQNALDDPNARELFTYIVSCALPDGQDLQYTDNEGVTHTFEGSLGLAPDWGKPHGRCNETCQQWISGCVLSRLDYLGQHVDISIRGQNRALATTWHERHTFTQREATYYGNIFSQPQRMLGCLAPGETSDPRVCGPSLDGCAVTFTGTCDDVCGAPRADGSFPSCRGPSDHNLWSDASSAYAGSVTVFLHP